VGTGIVFGTCTTSRITSLCRIGELIDDVETRGVGSRSGQSTAVT